MKNYLKRFTLLALVFAVAFTLPPAQSQAQVSPLISPVYGNALDTVTNTGVKVLWLQLSGYRETVTATINITKISGTLGGTLIPIASNDGVNFYQTGSINTSDTAFTITNVAAQGKNYSFPRGYLYYGVQWTGTGTMSGSFNGKLLGRKSNN